MSTQIIVLNEGTFSGERKVNLTEKCVSTGVATYSLGSPAAKISKDEKLVSGAVSLRDTQVIP
jgi:hypothetical protein